MSTEDLEFWQLIFLRVLQPLDGTDVEAAAKEADKALAARRKRQAQ